jgi:hypothetical protein
MNSSDPSNHLLAWIIVLLAAIGVPPVVYFDFAQLITQHPLEALVLFLLYELAIIFIATVKLVWRAEFQNSFVKAVAGSVRTVIYFPSRWIYQKYYCNHLRKVYGSDEVRWLSSSGLEEQRQLKLEQVFIEPAIDLKDPSNRIQYYLASERYSKPLVLLGEVGIGKSTLLHYIALSLVDRKKRLEWRVSYELPFYLSLGLGAFIDKLKENKDLSLAEALEVAMRDKGWRQAPSEWIERRLKKGRCLILLDGLDEVADAGIRQQVVTWIQHQIDSDNEHGFVITSRPLSYRESPLERVFVRHIQRFTSEQIDTFIKKWYEATSGNLLKAEELKNQLHETSYNLLELVRNPLLLRMAIIVHQYRGTLPQSRVELYKDIFEVYLRERAYPGGRWRWIEAPRDNSALSAGERQEILQTLAYNMMEREITQIESTDAVDLIKAHFENMPITSEQFLQSVRHNGILGPFPSPFYGFAHRSFQEYLAAMYVKDCHQPELLVNHRNPEKLDWWRETIVLYGAQADPTPLMEACLKEESLLGDAFDLALILMEPEVHNNVELLKKSKPEVHGTQMRFERAVSLATEAKDTRYKIANALLKQRKWRLIPEDESSEEEPTKDSSFIKCAEYQLFLDEPEYRTCQPDHWQDDRFPSGQGLEPVLGVRPSDANSFCKWLTAQESGAWHYRLPTSKETLDISVGEAGRGYWIDDGNGFCWARGEPLSSSILSQDRLRTLWTQDDRKPEVHNLANYISFVDKLEDVHRRHHDLVEHLTSIHEHISKHKSNLEGNFINAKKHKKGLDEKIDQVVSRKAVYERTLLEIANLRKKLDAVREKENDLEKKENDLPKKLTRYQAEQIKLLKANSQGGKSVNLPQKRLASGQRIQPAIRQQARIVKYNPTLNQNKARLAQLEKIIGDLQQQQKQLEEDHKNAKSEESVLLKKLENADEREKSTN